MGNFLLLMPARLYYPVDVVEVAKKMKLPTSVDYNDSMVVVTESEEDRIIVLDLEGTTLLNPSQMNVKQI